ncbi:MAG TPA: aspartyl/asparaginyl beta-hydroxylase domain-containing protein [Planctomycetota bacterium]|nr:aspartyl/asparaginyl beta-hydroxylase domain-containing protein [Planctomycetota bacterium]
MFRDSREFPWTAALEAAFPELASELGGLPPEAFEESSDALSIAAEGYDERGWRYLELFGRERLESRRALAPRAATVAAAVPGMVNAGFSLLGPGTHLEPHRGELAGVLRCHLALRVPQGDCAIAGGGETRRWVAGRCLVFDDTVEHEAWNHGDCDRVVLLVTFRSE